MDARRGAARSGAPRRNAARPVLPVPIRYTRASWNSRGARCRRRFSHLVTPSAPGPPPPRLLCHKHTRAHGGETRRPSRNRERAGRGRARGLVGPGGGSRTGRLSRRAAPRSYGRRLPTSHLATGTHKQISDNGHAPSPTVSSTAATASPTRPGRGTAAFDRHGRLAARDFHGNVAAGAYVLAVNRKYDDCHGGPSPTPQELTRAGHCRIVARASGSLRPFRPAGGSPVLKN